MKVSPASFSKYWLPLINPRLQALGRSTSENLEYIFDGKVFFHENFFFLVHSHKKRKDSLEGSLKRVLFAAELGFPKVLVPGYLRIHQI